MQLKISFPSFLKQHVFRWNILQIQLHPKKEVPKRQTILRGEQHEKHPQNQDRPGEFTLNRQHCTMNDYYNIFLLTVYYFIR